ncbi:hypothetical protein UG55_108111 [Frankia sp. EI5c]|nr:hypothetical protein UG55_108111 [Frankia sp. EI5c]
MTRPDTAVKAAVAGRLRPWRFVLVFGTVSLLADFVYEGARSVTGPLLASLGASALVVGVVTGVGSCCPSLWPADNRLPEARPRSVRQPACPCARRNAEGAGVTAGTPSRSASLAAWRYSPVSRSM